MGFRLKCLIPSFSISEHNITFLNFGYKMYLEECLSTPIILSTFHIELCQTVLHNWNDSYQEVRFFTNEQWYYLCSDSFTESAASLVCVEQGNHGLLSIKNISFDETTEIFPIYPNTINCTGNEDSLCDCSITQQACNSTAIAAVECILPGM